MDQKTLIGLRIKELRKHMKLSQEQLAELAETSTNYLSRMERGTENPTLDMLIHISAALDVEMWELFDFNHERNPKKLKEMIKKSISQVDDDEKLKTAVRVLRMIIR